MKILDVGCGAGKQCFLYSDFTERKAEIIGGDVSKELLDKAKAKNAERGDNIRFQFLDFNKPFEFEDNTFDLVSSAFAIYYARNMDFTFNEAHRVLKPGGRLFVTGPLPENKQMFYDIINEATSGSLSKGMLRTASAASIELRIGLSARRSIRLSLSAASLKAVTGHIGMLNSSTF